MSIPASQAILWVKDELENSLARVRLGWESFTQDPGQKEALGRCLTDLHEIRGVLQVVGISGGALLTQEIERVLRVLKEQEEPPQEPVLEQVTRALMQLPMYLERVAGTRRDSVRMLLPQINALRTSIGSAPLDSENLTMELRFAERTAATTDHDIRRLAHALRPQFQSALLSFYRDPSNRDAVNTMIKVAQQIEAAAQIPAEFELWWLAGGFLESVRDGGHLLTTEIKQLIGRLDRELHNLQKKGEQKRSLQGLNQSLRTQVLHSTSSGSRVTAIRSAQRSEPKEDNWSASTADLSGPSQALLRTVGSVIREDLGRVKDRIDLYVRGGFRESAQVVAATDLLKKVCDTLTVLGLSDLSESLDRQRRFLSDQATGTSKAHEDTLLQVASVLLQIEDQLEDEINLLGKTRQLSDSSAQREAYGRARSLVVREVLVNLSRVKQIVADFISHPNQAPTLQEGVRPLLTEIVSALQIAGFESVAELIVRLNLALDPDRWLTRGRRLSTSLANRVADAIVSIEYWLENIRLNRGTLSAMLDNAESCIAGLEQAVPEVKGETTEEPMAEELPEGRGASPAALDGVSEPAPSIVEGTMETTSVVEPVPFQGVEPSSGGGVSSKPAQPRDREASLPPLSAAMAKRSGGDEPASTPEFLVVLRADAEPEIVPIFLEEAREVVRNLQVSYEMWLKNPEEETGPRTTIRRGFHTLKGSGRLAGALRLAEYAWKVESLLNRIIDNTLPTSADRVAFVGASISFVSELIKELEQGKARLPDYVERFRRAEALISRDDLEPETTPAPVPRIDPALYGIFSEEARHHMAVLREWLGSPQIPVPFSVSKAAHTLNGVSQMAQLEEMVQLFEPINHYFEALAYGLLSFTETDRDRLHRSLVTAEQCVGAYGNRQDLLPAVEPLHAEWQAVLGGSSSLLPESEKVPAQTGEAGREVGQLHPSPFSTRLPDPSGPSGKTSSEIQVVFLEEARELLEETVPLLEAGVDTLRPDQLSHLKRTLHTLKGGARVANFQAIASLAHELESVLDWATLHWDEVARDQLGELIQSAIGSLHQMLAQARQGQVPREDRRLMTSLARFMTTTLERQPAGIQTVESTPKTGPEDLETVQAAGPDPVVQQPGQPATPSTVVRVRAELLDQALNEAGEVGIYRARLEEQVNSIAFNLAEHARTVERLREQLRRLELETEAQMLARRPQETSESQAGFDPLELDRYTRVQELSRALAESVNDLTSLQHLLDNLIRESSTLLLQQGRVNTILQDNLMRGRLVSVQSVAPRLERVVERTAREAGKQARLLVQGTEAELDRRVLDRLVAPLEHMVRNAVFHGIESPERRQTLGKNLVGQIALTFRREGPEVIIEVADDGAGLNFQAIRDKAIELDLIPPGQEPSQDDLIQMIFRPGFSTARTLTQTAGRGVGMDVVSAEIRDLAGTVEVTSETGHGTRMLIRLPFTLAISQSLLVTAGTGQYAVPLHSIEGVGRMTTREYEEVIQKENPVYLYGGRNYRIMPLLHALGRSSEVASGTEVISLLLARGGDDYRAFAVDALIGSREIVVKPLGIQMASIPGISGATILGDGSIIFVLDPVGLVRALRRRSIVADATAVLAPAVRPRQRGLVLVVDDSITMRRVSQRFLERSGIEVMTAKDGVDALMLLGERIPDVALVDIEMPRMDGFELSTRIRADERLNSLPIVIITSRSGEKHRQRAQEIGVNAYLPKPYREEELLETLHRLRPDRFSTVQQTPVDHS
jgi:chemosensory pili system protein ChpA (sensor histidine kinase/response regulator)